MSILVCCVSKISSFIRIRVIFILALISGSTLFNTELSGQGNLLITPRRVVFEGSKRSIDLNLANTGQDTATYAISLIQIRMREDGGFETISVPDPGQMFADQYIRFFPRSVTLGPNEAQVVKVQLVRAAGLADGEYRSHFYFRSVPKARPLGEKEVPVDTTTISVKLTPIFGITIPVIIRVGESSTNVTLSDLSFESVNDTIPRIKMILNRTGNMSVYGNLTVDYISPQGKIVHVGEANGLAVYTPNKMRKFQFDLSRAPGVDFRSGQLRVIYSSSSDIKPVRYTEAELLLNK